MSTTPLSSNGEHHITPVSTYFRTIIALVILMAATVAIADYWSCPEIVLGSVTIPGVWVNNAIAMAIATAKALLVIMFFMGVKYSSSLVKIWVVAGFLVLTLMFTTLGDYLTRKNEPAPGWAKDAPTALPRSFNPLDQPPLPEQDQNVRIRQ